MNIVRARLDPDIDDGAGFPAVLCPGIFFRLEFINGIHGQDRPRIARGHDRIHDALTHPGIIGDDAVHEVHVIVGALAVGALGPARAAGIDRNARPKLQQVFKITAIQGQVFDDLSLQGATKLRVGSLDQGYRLRDGDLFGLLAGLQG